MPDLLDFLRSHEEAFRSRTRLASLYSDFRSQRHTNPDGYQANASVWLRALSAASNAGVVPAQNGAQSDRFVMRTGEELSRALQTQEFGRPLALGAVVQDAVDRKELVPLAEFLNAQKSIYAKSWIPTPWQAVRWGLKQLGVVGGESAEDRLVAGSFVVMANVEAAAKAVLDEASRTATSNTSRIFSRDLFASTFAPALGTETLSPNDLSVLLTHLSRDRAAIAYSPETSTLKFTSPASPTPTPITPEDANIASIRTLISTLTPQVTHLTTRLADLDAAAKAAVAAKNLPAARNALRAKKLADAKLQQRAATLAQLEDVYGRIEQAADQVELVRVMEASARTLRSLNAQTGGVERVQDVMEGLREEMADVEEVGRVVGEVGTEGVDEGEVEDELEGMERAERERVDEEERKKREVGEEREAEETRRRLAVLGEVEQGKEDAAPNAAEEARVREMEAERPA
ncbi:hypothetical protein WHR41_03208 [Cladosporium halotolerans]|uniref:Uncharacterized protein n=1 Tax=Cladosporium halotolerans TaxID=1052096 RepID=A0AB34KX83_9PEZI